MAGRKSRRRDADTISATKALPEDLPAGGSDGGKKPAGTKPSAPKASRLKSAAPGPAGGNSAVKTPGMESSGMRSSGMKSGGRTLAAKASAARSSGSGPVRSSDASKAAAAAGTSGARPAAGSAAPSDSIAARGPAAGKVLAFPEPPGRRRRRNAWIAAGSAIVLTGLFFAFLFFSPALALKTVVVEGTSLLPRAEAEAALEPLKGQTLPSISDADVAALLQDRPEIESIDVAAQPPSTLTVTVTERIPVAVLQDGAQHVLVDKEGRRLAVAADRAAVPLPLIAGGSEAVNAGVFPSITSVLAALPPEVLGRLESASAQTVDSVELKLNSGQTVFWGSGDGNAAKARVLEALLNMAPTDPPVQVYDVSAPDRPVTR